MCKEFKATHYLRISNRGNAVNTIVENHSFSVNLPSCLRSLGPCKITVQDAMVNLTLENNNEYMEVYVTSNLPINQSMDTETYTDNNFDGIAYNKLVTFQSDYKQYRNRLRPNSFLEFDVSSIPERFMWSIWRRSGNGSTIRALTQANAYNFITLKIQPYH
jgi:hypothetical protein